jgi:hypothetical protein
MFYIKYFIFSLLLSFSCVMDAFAEEIARESPNTTQNENEIEYIRDERDKPMRVLVTTQNAARVDILIDNTNTDNWRSLFLPADGREVARLIEIIDEIAQVSEKIAIPVINKKYCERKATVRIKKSGVEKVFKMNESAISHNLVWEGVRQEIEAVALVKLAIAFDMHEDGKKYLTKNDLDRARKTYYEAMLTLYDWEDSRHKRYTKSDLWGPEFYDIKYRTVNDLEIGMRIDPHRIPGLPYISKESEIKCYQYAWDLYAENISFSRSGDIVNVTFKRDQDGWSWGLPQLEISPDVMEKMKTRKIPLEEIKAEAKGDITPGPLDKTEKKMD